jgi:hypothetical protein
MANTKINPEVVRLTRRTAEQQQLPFFKQAARCLAEQAIMDLDPELGFLIESDLSLASRDTLVRSAQVNDIVVNGRHIDICVLEGDEARLPAALFATTYIECGSLAVQMADASLGSIVGYIDEQAWAAAAAKSQGDAEIRIKFAPAAGFELASCLELIEKKFPANVNKPAPDPVKGDEVLQFVRSTKQVNVETQRRVISAALGNEQVRDSICALDDYTSDNTNSVLRDSSAWETRVNRISKRLLEKLPFLNKEQLEKALREIGEQYGGQPDSPRFRETLSKRIARMQLTAKASAVVREALSPFIDSLAAGKNAAEAIKSVVKDKVAVDVARVIKEKRNALGKFAGATADEIGFAFQQLALQPAYATHSQSESGVEPINEALVLYEAAAIVDAVMTIDFE